MRTETRSEFGARLRFSSLGLNTANWVVVGAKTAPQQKGGDGQKMARGKTAKRGNVMS